ncbi:ComEC/Rec2 family competence protein [Manganibacter manganicus]|uniref:Competence protein n=1 Tax=Manganibacter manganicus TaxID=1873176 RepID=A0A1V8RIY2_9HYPH|nr:ComEC/Rec2 family competence protein [Pseudaminobacter manganicus]OQM73181.1 competence protein [Pseudaminobacter manganicus]
MAGESRSADKTTNALPDTNERDRFSPARRLSPAGFLPDLKIHPVEDERSNDSRLAYSEPSATSKQWRLNFSTRSALNSIAQAARLELDRGVAFLLMPVFIGAGIVWYFSLTEEPGFLQPTACVLALGLAVIAARGRPRLKLALIAALLCAFGVLAAKFETWRVETLMVGSGISTHVTGRVVALDHMASGRVRLTLDVTGTARPRLYYQPERVRLSARRISSEIGAGSLVSGYARLLPPTGPVRPGGYDYSFQSYFDGIGGSGFFMTDPKPVATAHMPITAQMSAAIENARNAIAARIRRSIGGPEGEIAAALIVGVRAGIPEEINEAMRRTGIYHIISISGLHMALVAGTIMLLLRGAFALFPDFVSRYPVKKYAAFAALATTGAYLIISGMVVAAERSFIMLAVMLVAILFDRAALTVRNLSISALIVMLWSPHEVAGPSFQMSFAATAALVGGYATWADYRAGKTGEGRHAGRPLLFAAPRWMLVVLAGTCATTLIAGSATTLYAAWHFQRVSPLSLIANLAVMPVVSVVVMPFAVLSAIAMPFGADGPFLYVMGKGLSAMIAIAAWLSKHSPIDTIGLVSPQSVLLATIALVIVTMATTRLRWAMLPFAAAALLTVFWVRTPDLLVSENGKLLAMPIGGGELSVNRPRPNGFTLDNWRRAFNAETVIKPEAAHLLGVRLDVGVAASLLPGTSFLCANDFNGLCVARHPSGAIVAWAANAKDAKPACAYASIIVIEDATAQDPCRDKLVMVITARQLARFGSAAVYFDRFAADERPTIRYAVETRYRPWHEHRQFSREARGLAPYRRTHTKQQKKD